MAITRAINNWYSRYAGLRHVDNFIIIICPGSRIYQRQAPPAARAFNYRRAKMQSLLARERARARFGKRPRWPRLSSLAAQFFSHLSDIVSAVMSLDRSAAYGEWDSAGIIGVND